MALQGWASSHHRRHQGKHGLSASSPARRWSLAERAALGAGQGNSAAADARCTGEVGPGDELQTVTKHGAESPGPICAGHCQGRSGSPAPSRPGHRTPAASRALGPSCPAPAAAPARRRGPSCGHDGASAGCGGGRRSDEDCPSPPCPNRYIWTDHGRRRRHRRLALTSPPGAARLPPAAAGPAPGQSRGQWPSSCAGTTLGSRKPLRSRCLLAAFLCRRQALPALLQSCMASVYASPPPSPGLTGP